MDVVSSLEIVGLSNSIVHRGWKAGTAALGRIFLIFLFRGHNLPSFVRMLRARGKGCSCELRGRVGNGVVHNLSNCSKCGLDQRFKYCAY